MNPDRKAGCFEKYNPFKKKFCTPTDKLQKSTLSKSYTSYISVITRILRILEFILTSIIFAFTIFMITNKIFNTITEVFAIVILTITTIYIFATCLDIVSQFYGSKLPNNPMLLFSFLGVILFTIAGNLLISVYINNLMNPTWFILTTLSLCFILALLFLFDVMTFFTYKQQKTASYPCLLQLRNKCGLEPEMLFIRNECYPTTEKCKCDLATSISSLRPVSITNESTDHAYRKIGFGQRREYVETQTSAPSLRTVDVAQLQTDPPSIAYCSVQTSKCEVKEKPIQTLSHCDTCHTPFNPALCPIPVTQNPINFMPPQCGVCPGLLHLIQDKEKPCCNSCNCGTNQTIQETHRQKTIQSAQTSDSVGYDGQYPMHSSESTVKSTKLPETVTKVAMFSYIQRHKKTQTPTKHIINEELVDSIDEFNTRDSTTDDVLTQELIRDKYEIRKHESKEKEQSNGILSTKNIEQNKSQEAYESTESEISALGLKENDNISQTGTYRKKNKIRPIVRDTLYRK